jgi:protein TonB
LTQKESSVAIKATPDEDKPAVPQPAIGPDAADTAAMILELEAEIAEQTRAYNQRPRRGQITGVRARQSNFARYYEDWRAKIEHISELHYPAAARGKMYDNLLITVSIKKDGSIDKIVIHRHSKYPVLNEAALKIARLGEPYAPFPPEIAKDYEVIDITRTWTFTNRKLGITNKR